MADTIYEGGFDIAELDTLDAFNDFLALLAAGKLTIVSWQRENDGNGLSTIVLRGNRAAFEIWFAQYEPPNSDRDDDDTRWTRFTDFDCGWLAPVAA